MGGHERLGEAGILQEGSIVNKKVGFSFTPGKVRYEYGDAGPVTLPSDQHCVNCGDDKTVLELDGSGMCFDPCRYGRLLRKDGR